MCFYFGQRTCYSDGDLNDIIQNPQRHEPEGPGSLTSEDRKEGRETRRLC